MNASDLHRYPFYRTMDWVASRDPDLASALNNLARYATESVWVVTKARSRDWCRLTEEGRFDDAARVASAIAADARTYNPPIGKAAA